jgi:hypothetical protein
VVALPGGPLPTKEVRASPFDTRVDREKGGAGHAVLQLGRRRVPQGASASRQPLVEGADVVSSYALDDGERLLLFDPQGVPHEIDDLARRADSRSSF